jgi:S1 RNA binding domain protein
VEQQQEVKVGDLLEVEVFKIASFGAFVRLPNKQKGLIHISQVADEYVKDVNEHLKIGDRVTAKVLTVADGKIDLTLKQKQEKEKHKGASGDRNKGFKFSEFENKMKAFLRKSEEKQAEIRRQAESRR